MQVESTEIPDVRIITPKKFGDHRGFFSETYNQGAFEAAGLDLTFVQDNHSFSTPKGTLRGLHFQTPPHGQAKLLRVICGAIYDVAVDIRKGSPTYGKWVARTISAAAWNQILVPVGFAHGFCTIEENTEVLYKVTGKYAPECEGGLTWNDPDLAIDWPLDGAPILSAKDESYKPFAEFDSPFIFEA